MMTIETVLRVALAIFSADTEYSHRDWKDLKQPEREHFISLAEAAIEEIDKPVHGFYGVQLA